MQEESSDIIFKNVAIVTKNDDTEPKDSLITRVQTYNIGLECRLPKTSVHTIKGKGEDNVIEGLQTLKIHSYASKLRNLSTSLDTIQNFSSSLSIYIYHFGRMDHVL